MKVFLVHHGDAVGPDVDALRPLSARGFAEVSELASRAKEAAVAPAIVWHSGKLRARQTAEAFLRACSPFAKFVAVRGLQPEDPANWIADALAAESADIMVVGHMPHLPALARLLSPSLEQFPLHGIVAFERVEKGTYVERWRARPNDS